MIVPLNLGGSFDDLEHLRVPEPLLDRMVPMIPAPPRIWTASVVTRIAVSAANALANEPRSPASSAAVDRLAQRAR